MPSVVEGPRPDLLPGNKLESPALRERGERALGRLRLWQQPDGDLGRQAEQLEIAAAVPAVRSADELGAALGLSRSRGAAPRG